MFNAALCKIVAKKPFAHLVYLYNAIGILQTCMGDTRTESLWELNKYIWIYIVCVYKYTVYAYYIEKVHTFLYIIIFYIFIEW